MRVVADRLYSVSLRAQELALYRDAASYRLRYAPIAEPGDPPATSHFKLLVLEIEAEIPAQDDLAASGVQQLSLAKIGWELELATDEPCLTAGLPEGGDELPRLLGRAFAALNDLGRLAGHDPLVDPGVADALIHRYRSQVMQGTHG